MTMHNKPVTSAADIEIPDELVGNLPPADRLPLPAQPAPSGPDEETNAVFRGLRQLMRKCGQASKNDRAITLIKATIGHGWNTRMRIVGTAITLGFTNKHINAVLRNSTGDNPRRHHWTRDEKGVYTVHDQAQATEPSNVNDRAAERP